MEFEDLRSWVLYKTETIDGLRTDKARLEEELASAIRDYEVQ